MSRSRINGRQLFGLACMVALWSVLLLATPCASRAAHHPVDRTDEGNYVMFPVPVDSTGQPMLGPETGKPDAGIPVSDSSTVPVVNIDSASFSIDNSKTVDDEYDEDLDGNAPPERQSQLGSGRMGPRSMVAGDV